MSSDLPIEQTRVDDGETSISVSVRIDRAEMPQLYETLVSMKLRARAGRLRALAAVGLIFEFSTVAVGTSSAGRETVGLGDKPEVPEPSSTVLKDEGADDPFFRGLVL
jgi:hypothetical protein